MAKSADEFLNDLAARELVPAEIVASLRRQAAKSAQPVPAAAIAKLLTDKGHLTAAQAQQLLGGGAPSGSAPVVKARQPAAELGLTPLDDGLTPLGADELMPLDGGLAPLGDVSGLSPIDELGLTPLDDDAPLPAAK